MRRSSLALGAIAAFGALAGVSAPSIAGSNATVEADAVQASPPIATYAAAARAAAEEHDTPAFVMAFVSSKGVDEFVSFGVRDRSTGLPISERSQFQIASLSKIQTGIIIRNLVLEGRLDPKRRIVEYLPNTIDGRVAEKLGEATLGQLISHRSGLPRDTTVIVREGNDPLLDPLTEDLLLRDLTTAEMVGRPSEVYEYSNLGYALLSYIAEQATEESFEALHKRYLVEPYTMNRTMVTLDESGEKALATPYRKEDANRATSPWNTGLLSAASGIYSTPDDLARLLVAQLKAYRTQDDAALDLTSDGMPVNDTRSYGYGLSKQVVTIEDEAIELFYHSGDMDGYAGFYTFVPEKNRGVVMLTTRGGDGADKLRNLAVDYVLARAPRE